MRSPREGPNRVLARMRSEAKRDRDRVRDEGDDALRLLGRELCGQATVKYQHDPSIVRLTGPRSSVHLV